jgi:hypothetical protein
MLARWTSLALATSLLGGCAQISATTELRTVPVPNTPPLAIESRVIERQLEARWQQRGDTLAIELLEHRRCQKVEHIAAIREEHSVRKPDAAIYWEYAAAVVLLGIAGVAFARPDLFAVPEADVGGKTRRDPTTGRALGGVFLALGSAALGAGIYDTVRARDRVYRASTVALRPGPAVVCDEPTVPAAQRQLALRLGQFHSQVATDLEGRARFLLPGPELWPPEEEDVQAPIPEVMEGSRPRSRRWRGTLQVGLERWVEVEVVLPYDQTALVPSTGAAMSVAR